MVENTINLGITPFVLSGIYFIGSDKKKIFFVMLISISILLGLGGFTPLYHLLYLSRLLTVYDTLLNFYFFSFL